ncbi:hypothetical protein BABINDRAFT_161907 [Babjeviella inositovora NRRL Y-12698]|uniref:Tricalbin n=1 Tax=Babjeviella inositovora NRRL Y-12698 TaxID=984486 RepID=A0A1E3QP79_9ASCO|nr:uncharacterized protein BABINDRAFT_161907 [Babjeviella inositovora NRRL Y-12698]ODQ79516.1 hypothetical protein BABINDRAFT_161907 [Babjeviella inositovora NRRL Y-12698]
MPEKTLPEKALPVETAPVQAAHGFNWKPIGGWDSTHTHVSSNKLVENYIIDKFYSDWYYNTVLVVGTCFFSWLVARWNMGFVALVLVLLCASSVYRAEFRRFNRNIRDDMTRVVASERLETQAETMDWMNSFLAKFWVIYMPALSEMVLTQAKAILEDAAPGFGIDALTLDEFTLGSKAPTVDSIKSYTKKGPDHVEMDWAFSFRPMDTDNMTKNEIKTKVNPKVALGVRIGKGFVSKSLPILVENMEFVGRMNVKLKLSNNFPHIKMVSVSFLEPPLIDYALKPVGGDTFGLDIMSLIPGLSTFVNTLIHGTLRPMVYAPNSFDVNVEELMAAQAKDAIGCLAITIESATGLQCSDSVGSLDPYFNLYTEKNAAEIVVTDVKADTSSPKWNETKYLLVNSLEQQLCLDCLDSNGVRADKPVGSATFDLRELLQEDVFTGLSARIMDGDKLHGTLSYSLRWYPVQAPEVLEDGTKELPMDSEVGILKLTLHEAAKLDTSVSMVGVLNPYAEIRINSEKVRDCRALKRTNEPSWEESVETLVTSKSGASVTVTVKDNQGKKDRNPVIAEYSGPLDDVLFNLSRGEDWFKCHSSGQIRLSALWKPLAMTGVESATGHLPAVGALRLNIRHAKDMLNLEVVGKVDPYVKVSINGRLLSRTVTIDDCLDPVWNEVLYLPIQTEHQHIALDTFDYQNMTKDRPLGSTAISVGDFMKRGPDGNWLAYEGNEKVITAPLALKNKNKGTIFYSVSFIPTMPVYTRDELTALERAAVKQAEQDEKDAEEQARMEKLYKENPKDYEWYEHVQEDEMIGPKKQSMTFDEVTSFQSGVLSFDITGALLTRLGLFVHFILDDFAFPAYVSARAEGKTLGADSGEAFIRDLQNSKFILRIAKKAEVTSSDDVVCETSFHTLDLLTKGYSKPVDVASNGNSVQVQFELIPSSVVLPASEMAADVGKLQLEVLGAEGLMAADRNGKSDPYVKLFLNNCEVFKSEKVKKTLDPTWNELVTLPIPSRSRSRLLLQVYDWDAMSDDDLLGSAMVDLTQLEALKHVSFSTKLDTQGLVRFKALFAPEYIRPVVGKVSGVGIDLNDVTGAPLKVVSGVADITGGAVGGAAGLVGGAGQKGTSFLKSTFLLKKKDKSVPGSNVSDDSNVSPAVLEANAAMGDPDSELALESDTLKPPAPLNSAVNPRTNYANEVQAARGNSVPPSPHAPTPRSSFNVHRRNVSTTSGASSFAESGVDANGAMPGRVTIVSAQGNFDAGALVVKVSLLSSTKSKDLYKTRAVKAVGGVWKWHESSPFKASVDTTMLITVKENHKFGKNVEVGTASVDLSSVVGRTEDFTVNIGTGSITLNFHYN